MYLGGGAIHVLYCPLHDVFLLFYYLVQVGVVNRRLLATLTVGRSERLRHCVECEQKQCDNYESHHYFTPFRSN